MTTYWRKSTTSTWKNEEELNIYKNKMMNVAHGDTKDYEELSAMNGISEDMM